MRWIVWVFACWLLPFGSYGAETPPEGLVAPSSGMSMVSDESSQKTLDDQTSNSTQAKFVWEEPPKKEEGILTSFGLTLGPRFEKNVNQDNTDGFGAVGAFGGVHWEKIAVLGEFYHFEDETGTGNLKVTRRRYELTPWVRYNPRFFNKWSPYVTAGTGLYWEKVSMKLGSSRKDLMSRGEWQYGLGLGVNMRFLSYSMFDVEYRLLDSKKEDLHWDVLLRLGVLL